jgi:hypothetical protein
MLGGLVMVSKDSVLVSIVSLIDRIPELAKPVKRSRGRPQVYSDKLFLKALVIMIIRHLASAYALYQVLDQPSQEMQALRSLLALEGRYPCRRTFERRLAKLPSSLPAQIACLGAYLLELLKPWACCGRAAAMDSTLLEAKGGVWHQKDRKAGLVPHSSIDTEAHWSKSGWHGWVYGWKLHLVVTVASVWIPLAARLTPANTADNTPAPEMIHDLPQDAHYVLGDLHYHADKVQAACDMDERILVTPNYGAYPHADEGKEVRRIFHLLRHRAIENFNEQFKAIFELHHQVPTKGLINTQCFALGAILVYQLVLLYRFEHDLSLRLGLKAFVDAL